MKLDLFFTVCAVLFIFFSSCAPKRVKISKNDLFFYNSMLQTGTRIYINANTSSIATLVITRAQRNYSTYKPNGIPLSYKCERIKIFSNEIGEDSVLLAINMAQSGTPEFTFHLYGSFFRIGEYYQDDTLRLNIKLKNGKAVEALQITQRNPTDQNIVALFFTKECGLVRYITKDNSIWDLKD
jgi:hypothetical protein